MLSPCMCAYVACCLSPKLSRPYVVTKSFAFALLAMDATDLVLPKKYLSRSMSSLNPKCKTLGPT